MSVSQATLVPEVSSVDSIIGQLADNTEEEKEDRFIVIRDKVFVNVTSEDIDQSHADLDSVIMGEIESDNLHKYVTNKNFYNVDELNKYLRYWGKIPEFLEVKESPGKGWGVFAKEDIDEDVFLGNYTGIPRNSGGGWNCSHAYTFWMFVSKRCPCSTGTTGSQWICDAENVTFSNFTRFVNHNKEPNCVVKILPGNILFFTADPISKGDELTIDYGPDYWKELNQVPNE